MKTRIEAIAVALQELLRGFTDEEYEQMAAVLDYLDREEIGPAKRGMPTWKLRDMCPKYLLDELARNYLLDKEKRKFRPVFSERRRRFLYGELEVDAQVYRELQGLLSHCEADERVKNLVTDILGLPRGSDTQTIEKDITTRSRVEHLRLYNTIYRELKRQGLVSKRYDYFAIGYRWLSNLWSLSERGVSFLRKVSASGNASD